MAKNNNLTDFLTDVANAIREKKGSSDPINPQNFSDEIASIETGGGGGAAVVAESDVNFCDYDGTILHSYTKSQFLALSELPELPSQKGLICQEWNWSLEDARSFVEEYGRLEIGATYITEDGKTKLYIELVSEKAKTVSLYFTQTQANGVLVDWGDGSTPETFSGTSVSASHNYYEIGNYVITLDVLEGTLSCGGSSSNYSIMGYSASSTSSSYTNMLKKVELGNNAFLNNYAFNYCQSLSSIIIPKGVTFSSSSISNYCYSLAYIVLPRGAESAFFNNCYSLRTASLPKSITAVSFSECSSLRAIVLPDSITGFSDKAFKSCYSLKSVVIPNSVTSLKTYAFEGCYSLKSVVIPNGMTSISSYAFNNCYSLKSVEIPETVTAIGTYAFNKCHSLLSIRFPNNLTSILGNSFNTATALSSVVFPSGVTDIATKAFYNCYGIVMYDFRNHISVPTLASKDAFTGIASICKIVVPDDLYETWIAASNWSNYASKIVKASEYAD